MYTVKINRKAKREFDKIPDVYLKKIANVIYGLANNPYPYGYRKLVGYNDLYRIRVGVYRIIYTIKNETLIVEIIRIAHRGQVYE